ncbi:MAG: type II toxin-antitoxin system HicB family antitoxin [bacterium]|nr:type II toxin-antitoxin system HicB family antitoxin [bacterium]
MEYRGYRGVVIIDDGTGLLHGEVVNARDVITFQGSSAQETAQAFMDSVDEYLAVCSEMGREPDQPIQEVGSI